MSKYSFCETVTASSVSPWHIRELTAVGRKLGGGADTLALCGREVSWDLSGGVKIFEHRMRACSSCWIIYERECTKGAK